VARLDTPAKSNGSAIYGIDIVVPGMLNGAIKTAPSFTGRVIEVKNETDILKMPGVRAVVKLPASIAEDGGDPHASPRDNAVCVVADYFWQAKRAIDALDVAFDGGDHGDLSTAKIDAMLDAALDSDHGVVAVEKGDPRGILKRSASLVIERRFKLPHIAHAPHEPVNATASYRDGKVEVWGPIQSVTACQEAVAEAVGCRVDDVTVHVTFLGGSFGRKIVPDFVVQAVHAAKAVGRPVKLVRSREEDMQHDVYRPNAAGLLRAVLDERGYPLAIQARVAGQSLFAATRRSWLDQTPHGAWDESMVDGIYNQSYRIPHFLVETVDTPLPVPVYFMRSVGSTAAVFFWESLITELAHRAKIDQYAYRRNLLSAEPLALRVLDAVAQASGWQTLPPDTYRGIAYNCYVGRGSRFRTYVAQVVELRRVGRRLAVKRVFCAVDAGLAVNPNTLRAQIEGGIGFAMTTALKSAITFSNGGTDQSNFFDYPLLTIDEMPEVVPLIEESNRPPQGVGEVVLAPVGPAIAQALLQATGRRLDVMPFPDEVFEATGAQ
jgi:isoquinoline 1-oxidoreductase subunit beta